MRKRRRPLCSPTDAYAVTAALTGEGAQRSLRALASAAADGYELNAIRKPLRSASRGFYASGSDSPPSRTGLTGSLCSGEPYLFCMVRVAMRPEQAHPNRLLAPQALTSIYAEMRLTGEYLARGWTFALLATVRAPSSATLWRDWRSPLSFCGGDLARGACSSFTQRLFAIVLDLSSHCQAPGSRCRGGCP